jgi:hypothetical protein
MDGRQPLPNLVTSELSAIRNQKGVRGDEGQPIFAETGLSDLRLQTSLYCRAASHSKRYITNASTYPSLGCKNTSGNRPTIARPQLCHSRTAFSFVATTKLNCIARKARSFAAFYRMFAHHARNSSSLCRCGRHVATIGHVRPAAPLIRLQKIRADNFSILFRDKHLMVGFHPIGQRFVFAHLPWERVGLSYPNHWLQDPPDRVRILEFRPSYNSHKPNVAPLRRTAG